VIWFPSRFLQRNSNNPLHKLHKHAASSGQLPLPHKFLEDTKYEYLQDYSTLQ
jgi:hypothetical protein